MALTVTDLVTAYGAYYINSGQNMTRLKQMIRDRALTDELFSTRITDDTLYREAKVTTDRLLQPFQIRWTPIGTTTFTPVEIKLFEGKVDREEFPDKLEASWLGFLGDNNLKREEWPVIRWLIEAQILPQIKEDYELNEVFKGTFAAPADGVAGAAGTMMDGIKIIRNRHITGGRITPITMGAFPTTPSGDKSVEYLVCEYFEDFADQINDKYWGVQMTIATSPKRERQFLRGYAEKYGSRVDYSKNTSGAVDFTNLRVKGLPSHRGSDIIWTTPKENAIRLLKKSANWDRVAVEGEDRKVKIWTDFWVGIGFTFPELFFTNDLELPAPVV